MLRVWGLVCRVLRLRCAVSILAILLPVLAGGLALGPGAQAQKVIGITALAQTVTMVANNFACSWSTASCWVGGVAPTTGDNVVLPPGISTYDLGSGVALDSVTLNLLGGFAGPFSVSGGPIVLQAGGSITDSAAASGGADLPGVMLNGPTTISLTAGGDAALNIMGAITGTGPLTLSSNGAGLILFSTSDSWTGGTIISGTALVEGAGNGAIPTSSDVAINSGASLQFGTSSTIGSLSGAGTVNMGNSDTLTVGGDNISTTFSGVYQSSDGSSVGLAKTGTGTLTLSGANAYTGPTMVLSGTLEVNGSLAEGSTVTVAGCATLDGTGTIEGNVVLLGGATLGAGLTVEGTVTRAALTVTTLSDVTDSGTSCTGGATCSLRDAMTLANTDGTGDITFASGVTGTITLGSALPAITGTLILAGPSANQLTISGNNSTTVGTIFTIDSGATATVCRLTVANGKLTSGTSTGGGINNAGTTTVVDSAVSSNTANSGGGISNEGTLTVSNSTISGNLASNEGGGIFNAGTVMVSNSTISGNSAINESGGIFNNNGISTLAVTNSIVSGNTSGSGVSGNTSGSGEDDISDLDGNGDEDGDFSGSGNVVGDAASQIMLAPLGFYGGPTQTMPPLPESPALNAGIYLAGEPTTDQRGAPRPATVGNAIDSGAVQISNEPPLITAVSPNSGPTAGGTQVTITGTGLDGSSASNTSVDFGMTPVTTGNFTPSTTSGSPLASIMVTSPAVSSVGTVDVTVTNNFGTSATSTAAQFTYIVPVTELAFTAAPPPMLALDGNAGTVAVAEENTGGMTVATAADTITLTVTGPNSFSQTFTATAVSGVASFNLSGVTLSAAGSYTYTASIAGNAMVTPATAMETVSKGTPTITTLPTASAIAFGQTLASSTLMGGAANFDGATVAGTFTYTALATAPDAGTPSESVTFTPNDTADFNTATGMVTVTVNKAMATVTLGSLTQTYTGLPLAATATTNPAGLTVDFTYNGSTTAPTAAGSYAVAGTINDPNHQGSATGTLVIGKATATVTLGSLTQTFTGSPLAATATTNPAGLTVDFTYNGSTTAPTAAGSYAVVGTINDPNHQGSATGTLTVSAVPLTVTANNATKVYGTANPAFTGAVTGAVDGNTFMESFTTPATQNSNVGAYAITPSVTGAALSDYTVSATPGTLTVTQAATTTTLAVSASSLTPGQSLTLTAQVADASAGSAGTPAGTVSFYDGATLLGTVTLSGGVASYSTTALAAGVTNTLTASYSGNTNFTASSTMAGTTVSVAPLDFTFTTTGTSAFTAAPGAVATYSFGVSPLYGTYASSLSFTVMGLPTGATASFTPSTVAANSGATTVVLSVQTAAATAQNHSPFNHSRGIVVALLLLPFVSKRSVREKLKGRLLLMVLLMAGMTAAMSGCGSSGGFTLQSPQTYTLTVTATGGSVQHSLTTTLIVQ